MSDKNIELEEQQVTAKAAAAESMPKLEGGTPGQSGSAEDLGGPLTKPSPNTEPTPGKAASAKAKKGSSKVNAGASAPESMETLAGATPGQGGVKEDAEMSIDVSSDVEALLHGEEFSEEFKFKAATIFEAAVKAKVVEEIEKLEKVYEEKLNEKIEEIKESLEVKVDAHLDYVSEKWVAENQLAIDSGLRSELAEEFILGLKGLFEQHYVDIPEDKYDILGEMAERLDKMEENLNEQIETNVELNQIVGTYIRNGIIAEISEGLAQTQKEKLASLAEGVEFVSEESYREKIETIKENYFPKTQATSSEDLVEKTQVISESTSSSMAAYAAAIERWSK
jgi:hypothetical protein